MEIRSAKYLISAPKLELCPPPDRPEYAFIGRSNVGKSSLINLITGQAKLAKTSGFPGKTQLINHFAIESVATEKDGSVKPGTPKQPWYLVDLPGYGYAKVSQSQRVSWEKMITKYLTERENLVTIFVLIDSRHEPQKADLEFLDAIASWGLRCNLVFTKADKSTQRVTAANVRHFIDHLKKSWQFIPRTFVTSVTKGTGRREILSYIEELNEEYAERG